MLNPSQGVNTMNKLTALLLAALLFALPLTGSLAEAPPAESPGAVTTPAETPETETPPAESPASEAPRAPSCCRGWRRNQARPSQAPFVDENQDGLCDTCGQAPGQNPGAPGFTDEDQDGVCDHLGTSQQRQGRQRLMRGRQAVRKLGRMMRGRMGGMRGALPNTQGRFFQDQYQDGVCDHFNQGTGQPWTAPRGPGRNRR